jgi:uncharacterized membrane protein
MLKNFFSKRRNKTFYLTAVAQIVVIVQMALIMIGHGDLLTDALKNEIILFADAVLVLLSMFGVVNNPTIGGMKDGEE